MNSPEHEGNIETESTLETIVERYLDKLDQYKKGNIVYLFQETGITMKINPHNMRAFIADIVKKVELQLLSEDEARKKLWFGKAQLIIVKPSEV